MNIEGGVGLMMMAETRQKQLFLSVGWVGGGSVLMGWLGDQDLGWQETLLKRNRESFVI